LTTRPTRGALAAAVLAIALAGLASGCAAKRFLGFGSDGTLLVRHHERDPQEIWLDGDLLGVADSGAPTCFHEIHTGTIRVEARAEGGTLTRATSIVLTPDEPLLWDVDHDQVVDGRAFVRLCG
jgi:hypothetical protein